MFGLLQTWYFPLPNICFSVCHSQTLDAVVMFTTRAIRVKSRKSGKIFLSFSNDFEGGLGSVGWLRSCPLRCCQPGVELSPAARRQQPAALSGKKPLSAPAERTHSVLISTRSAF